jgi:hypothetical protein
MRAIAGMARSYNQSATEGVCVGRITWNRLSAVPNNDG